MTVSIRNTVSIYSGKVFLRNENETRLCVLVHTYTYASAFAR